MKYGIFRECRNLAQIEIPDSVTSIGNYAFEGCESLTQIEIPDSVTSIGDRVFYSCSSLTQIEIPDSVTSIGISAFRKCSSLKQIEIPDSVTSIANCAFEGCESLTQIEIPEGVTSIGEEAFNSCVSLTQINIPKTVAHIERNTFKNCKSLKKVIVSEDVSEEFLEQLYRLDLPIDKTLMFGEDIERFEKLKAKNRIYLEKDENYDEKEMDIFYHRMIKSVGIDEVEKMLELPKLTEEEIDKYISEKNDVFQELYEMKYQINGDLETVFEIFKTLNKEIHGYKKSGNEKNTAEMKIFRELNKILEEEKEKYSLTELIEKSISKAGYDIDVKNIEEIEKKLNSKIVKGNLEKVRDEIEQKLAQNGENETGIVQEQIRPIRIMIESAIKELIEEKGSITKQELAKKVGEKIENANAHYVRQNKENIVSKMLELIENPEIDKTLNHTAVVALKSTKEQIGGAWKYKINTALSEMGYTFDNLPREFTQEEIEKLQKRLKIDIESTKRAELKDEKNRESAYELLREFGDVVTYKQIHDMFGSVHEPYTEEFKNFFKEHSKEFLREPKYYMEFGRIQNNFLNIINSNELKNIYKTGKLEIQDIMGYLSKVQFANVEKGNEELARLSTTVGKITTEKEFEYVQKIFNITKRRERSSIPPMKIKKEKYEGRMLAPDDVLNLFAGNITTCCQKFGDVGEGAMLLGSIEENAGIFVVEEIGGDGSRNIVAQSLTIRQKGINGTRDRLCFDNIEIPEEIQKEMTEEDHKEILEIYRQAGQKAIETDKKFLSKLQKEGKISEEQYNAFVLKEVIAGTGYNDLSGLKDLEEAKVVVADEAHYKYKTKDESMMYPWIDSAGGQAPYGSKGKPVLLAEMEEKERKAIEEKLKTQNKNVEEIPLWYKNVRAPEKYTSQNITEEKIDILKTLEEQAYREEQHIMEKAETIEDIEEIYGIEDANIVIGSNNDWYLIYGESYDADIEISDLAIVGAMNAEKNGNTERRNIKLATAESTDTLYKLLIEAGEKGKSIHCDATKDTSLINIQRMLRKGLVKVYDNNDDEIVYDKNEGLIYKESGEKVEYRDFGYSGEIQMLGVYIQPEIEAIKQEEKKIEELLDRVKQAEILKGQEKEDGLEELRKTIRQGGESNDER